MLNIDYLCYCIRRNETNFTNCCCWTHELFVLNYDHLKIHLSQTPNANVASFHRMKLTLKTLSRDTFEVEIDESLKVSDLKKKVEEVRGPSHPAQNLKLIYAGMKLCLTMI